MEYVYKVSRVEDDKIKVHSWTEERHRIYTNTILARKLAVAIIEMCDRIDGKPTEDAIYIK
jgi:hypothetical protein